MRGSDPDAALHYLARMINSGEKPSFISRRIIICAAEDVGLADPNALTVAVEAAKAAEFVGFQRHRFLWQKLSYTYVLHLRATALLWGSWQLPQRRGNGPTGHS